MRIYRYSLIEIFGWKIEEFYLLRVFLDAFLENFETGCNIFKHLIEEIL